MLLLAAPVACDSITQRDKACLALEKTWSLDAIPAAERPCAERPAPLDLSSAHRLSLAVYHFNIQYVAGGLAGQLGISSKWDEKAVEDAIVRVSLEPLLDIYLEHPSFRADIELQAYTLEVIAQRHPDVLEKMQTLAASGQIDFDSLHYSDQLYVAYPRRDLEVSLDLTDQVFDRLCLPTGRSVFAQEGQFAVGQLALAEQHGREVSILPKNLFSYQFGDAAANDGVVFSDPAAPQHSVIIGGRGWSGTDRAGQPFDLTWSFMDDGEIALTRGKLNPYFADLFQIDPSRVQARIDTLNAIEAAGFIQVTVAEAVQRIKELGIVRRPLPPVLDGTWQPKDRKSVV